MSLFSNDSSTLPNNISLYSNKTLNVSRNNSYNQSFLSISTYYQTDKVTLHHYESLYEKYLHKYIRTDVYLLEIGLGCGMPYGPGASAYVWRTYLGHRAQIYFIEYDQVCGEAWYKTEGYKVST